MGGLLNFGRSIVIQHFDVEAWSSFTERSRVCLFGAGLGSVVSRTSRRPRFDGSGDLALTK